MKLRGIDLLHEVKANYQIVNTPYFLVRSSSREISPRLIRIYTAKSKAELKRFLRGKRIAVFDTGMPALLDNKKYWKWKKYTLRFAILEKGEEIVQNE